MSIRVAEKEDLEVLLEFADEYMIYQLLCAGFKYDREIFKNCLSQLIDLKTVMCITSDDKVVGGIGGRVVQSFYSKDIIFDVMMLYIDPDYRHMIHGLFADLEKILSYTDVTKLVICNPALINYQKHDRYYQIKGYHLLQKNYIKDIKREVTACQPA